MTNNEATNPQGKNSDAHETDPSRRDKLRPVELVGISAILAVLAGGVVAFVLSNEWTRLVPIVTGLVFIVALLGFALLGLATKPNAEDIEARKDLADPSAETENDSRDS